MPSIYFTQRYRPNPICRLHSPRCFLELYAGQPAACLHQMCSPLLCCHMFYLQSMFPQLELDFPNYQPALCSSLSEIIYSCQLLHPMVVGGVYVGIKMAGWQIPGDKGSSHGPFALKQGKMKKVAMRTSPPGGELKVSWASFSLQWLLSVNLAQCQVQISWSQLLLTLG